MAKFLVQDWDGSHLVRGAWIEIALEYNAPIESRVAPRERCVD